MPSELLLHLSQPSCHQARASFSPGQPGALSVDPMKGHHCITHLDDFTFEPSYYPGWLMVAVGGPQEGWTVVLGEAILGAWLGGV